MSDDYVKQQSYAGRFIMGEIITNKKRVSLGKFMSVNQKNGFEHYVGNANSSLYIFNKFQGKPETGMPKLGAALTDGSTKYGFGNCK